MKGLVDLNGRALLTVEVRAVQDAPALPFEAWIDTGFTGELVMPRADSTSQSQTRLDRPSGSR